MLERISTHSAHDIRDLAAELMRQSERWAVAGLPQQSEALLSQVCAIVEDRDPQLASAAAWELAWLLVGRGAYHDAAEWIGRMEAPPSLSGGRWPRIRQLLGQLCRAAQPAEPYALAPPALAPADAPQIQVASLGWFQIVRNGVALPPCSARKAIAVFRYLLTRRHQMALKEELMELLWADLPVAKAAHNLHVAVSTLRRYLDIGPHSVIVFEGDSYMINPDVSLEDDCATFTRLCLSGHQRQRARDTLQAQHDLLLAVACYQGDYVLGNLDFAWAAAERERLLTHYLSALETLGHTFAAEGHLARAIEYFQRLLERDNYREDIYHQLITCYWRMGRRTEALKQYERCATTLANELGLEPTQELEALHKTIMQSKAA